MMAGVESIEGFCIRSSLNCVRDERCWMVLVQIITKNAFLKTLFQSQISKTFQTILPWIHLEKHNKTQDSRAYTLPYGLTGLHCAPENAV